MGLHRRTSPAASPAFASAALARLPPAVARGGEPCRHRRTASRTSARNARRRAPIPAMAVSQPTNAPVVPAIIVVDHGSRRAAANEMLNGVTDMVRHRAGGIPVFGAHMELSEPSISDAYVAAVAGGANHVIVVPFFLAPGRHVTTDIPRLCEAAADLFPGVTYDVRPPIGTHPSIADVIVERAGAGVPFPAALAPLS
jgi:sirohydrochlorin ferrochelatase